MPIATINPATGETLRTFEPLTDAELEERLARADEAFSRHRRTSFDERAGILRRAAAILDDEVEAIATLMVTEMGKTITAARAEVKKCATGMRYSADHGAGFLAPEPFGEEVGGGRATVRYDPLGPVLAVMPWNFPLWQVTRFLAPAVMAGNVGLLKHASNVPQTALLIEDVMRRAGAGDVFQTLLIESGTVERVLRDPRVRAATLTGSTPAGASVAAICGDEIKKTVLELGGSDAFVVLPSADIDAAVQVAVVARCQNNGQSCIAAKRFLVHTDVHDEFASKFVAAMEAQVVGDPLDERTVIGPLATEQGRDDVEELLADAVANRAAVLTGGTRPDGPGWFFPPTVVSDLTDAARMHREEVFGPVASLYRVTDADEALALANDSDFGLGANVWTNDVAEQERFAADFDAGMVFVNGMVTSFPELPFGGVKQSGYGRELALHGARELTNTKTVWVKTG
ncbi:MAG TPA: NADP-dependent succinic semialdehyde dehydrogenase [Acidimicrobiales bacterium]|nr:NADP-dependent succinic semialdehyde dehydrogenase [Acidimicrobiales bacterium]